MRKLQRSFLLFDSDIIQSVEIGINQASASFLLGGISSKIVQTYKNNTFFDKNTALGYVVAISPAVASNIVGSYILQELGIPNDNPQPLQAALSVGVISTVGLGALFAYERSEGIIKKS